jgi:hypothetical protein
MIYSELATAIVMQKMSCDEAQANQEVKGILERIDF